MAITPRLALGTLLLTATTFVLGANFTLKFDSLPSAQGWAYRTDGPSESDSYSVDGTTLFVHTIGLGPFNTGYEIFDIVDPSKPFSISMRARILRTQLLDPSMQAAALVSYASTGEEVFGFGLDLTKIQAPLFTGVIHEIEHDTEFHDYRLEAMPGGDARFFVDNTLFASGTPLSVPNRNVLRLLNGSSEKVLAEITAFSFLQPIPEPPTLMLMLSGIVVLVANLAKSWRSYEKYHPTQVCCSSTL